VEAYLLKANANAQLILSHTGQAFYCLQIEPWESKRLGTTALEVLKHREQIIHFLWWFLVICKTAPGHNMFSLYGKEQHELAA